MLFRLIFQQVYRFCMPSGILRWFARGCPWIMLILPFLRPRLFSVILWMYVHLRRLAEMHSNACLGLQSRCVSVESEAQHRLSPLAAHISRDHHHYYHHPVTKPSNTGTKLRVRTTPCQPSSTGPSINPHNQSLTYRPHRSTK